MATATAKLAPETTTEAPATARGFPGLPCPRCGEEGSIHVHLEDVLADDALSCASCDETFGLDHVRALVAKWAPVLRWLDTAPAIDD